MSKKSELSGCKSTSQSKSSRVFGRFPLPIHAAARLERAPTSLGSARRTLPVSAITLSNCHGFFFLRLPDSGSDHRFHRLHTVSVEPATSPTAHNLCCCRHHSSSARQSSFEHPPCSDHPPPPPIRQDYTRSVGKSVLRRLCLLLVKIACKCGFFADVSASPKIF